MSKIFLLILIFKFGYIFSQEKVIYKRADEVRPLSALDFDSLKVFKGISGINIVNDMNHHKNFIFAGKIFTKDDSLNKCLIAKLFLTNRKERFYVKAYDVKKILLWEGLVHGYTVHKTIYLSAETNIWKEYYSNGILKTEQISKRNPNDGYYIFNYDENGKRENYFGDVSY